MAKKKKKSEEDGILKLDVSGIDTSSFERKEASFNPHRLAEQIIAFGEVLTGASLYEYQRSMAYSMIYSVITFSGDVKTVLLSRQSGKSFCISFTINTLLVVMPALAKIFKDLEQFSMGFRVGLFAPQREQVDATYRKAYEMMRSSAAKEVMDDPDIGVGFTSKARLELSNGSFLKGQVASKQSHVESATYDFLIVEEAQDCDDYIIEKSCFPMVSATAGTIIKIGTTGTMKNHYWRDIQYNKNLDRKIPDPRLHTHHEYDYKRVIEDRRKQFKIDGKKFHLNYENEVQNKIIARLGKESQAFKLGYALIWDLESGMLISDKEFNSLLNRKKTFPIVQDKDYIVAGLDIGKSPASTILTAAKITVDEDDPYQKPYKEIIGWLDLGGMDYEAQHRAIMDAIVDWNVSVIAVDYTGVGRPVVDRLAHACGEVVNIIPITFTPQSKSDLYYGLVSDITTKRIIVPANAGVRASKEYQNFEEQLKNAQKYHKGSYLVVEKTDGYFDDYCDSLALCCWAGNSDEEVDAEMEVMENPFYSGILNTRRVIQENSW